MTYEQDLILKLLEMRDGKGSKRPKLTKTELSELIDILDERNRRKNGITISEFRIYIRGKIEANKVHMSDNSKPDFLRARIIGQNEAYYEALRATTIEDFKFNGEPTYREDINVQKRKEDR